MKYIALCYWMIFSLVSRHKCFNDSLLLIIFYIAEYHHHAVRTSERRLNVSRSLQDEKFAACKSKCGHLLIEVSRCCCTGRFPDKQPNTWRTRRFENRCMLFSVCVWILLWKRSPLCAFMSKEMSLSRGQCLKWLCVWWEFWWMCFRGLAGSFDPCHSSTCLLSLLTLVPSPPTTLSPLPYQQKDLLDVELVVGGTSFMTSVPFFSPPSSSVFRPIRSCHILRNRGPPFISLPGN